MTRDEAEKAYVDAIMSRGNPEYFVWQVIENWNNSDLMEMLAGMGIEFEEIVEEE